MKPDRQALILKLIEQYQIETQGELVERLNESGCNVTQATVSRDIRELKLGKTAGKNGRFYYTKTESSGKKDEDRYISVLRNAFVSMDIADCILVIRTVPGMAMAAAAVLDEMNLKEVIGSIAGDNTIFCATGGREMAESLAAGLRKMLEEI